MQKIHHGIRRLCWFICLLFILPAQSQQNFFFSQTRGCTSIQVRQNGVCVALQKCNLPWGGTIASGASVTAYQSNLTLSCQVPSVYASLNPPPTNPSQVRTCTNGTLSGTYTFQSPSTRNCNCPAANSSKGSGLFFYNNGTTVTATCNTNQGLRINVSATCNNGTFYNAGVACDALDVSVPVPNGSGY